MPQPSIQNLAYISRKYRQESSVVHLYTYVLTCGLVSHTSLAKYLFCMLVEVGSYDIAYKVFNTLGCREKLYCTSLINGFIKAGELPLSFYLKLREDSVHPGASTLVALLKSCASLKDVTSGYEIHADMCRRGLVTEDPFIGSALVDMYAKCGMLAKAQETFDMLPVRDVVTWTALIAGYAQSDMGEEALKCLGRMLVEGVSPNAATFVCSLKASGSMGALDPGRDLHADIEMRSLLSSNQIVGNTLVDMYAKCGALKEARDVFDKLPVRDVVSWNALIGGYTEHNHARDALICFKHMQSTGVSPNFITFACSLKACGSICDIDVGQAIHLDLDRKGLLKTSKPVCTALVDMYARCGMLAKAKEVFDGFLIRDVISWNTLITGYVEHECDQEALNCYKQMQEENVSPTAITFFCSLKACGNIGEMIVGREIHAETARKGLLETNGCIGSALIEMYAEAGLLSKAQEVFDKLGVHDVISWNALIAGYIEDEHCEAALDCFEQMQIEGVIPDLFTFTYSLKACGNIGARDEGILIHSEVARKGLLHRDPSLGSMVIDLYAKCSLLSRAQEVFDKLLDRDLVTWTTLMTAYVQHERGGEALYCLNKMQLEGISPDAIACTCGLKACSNLAAVEKGREIHAEMLKRGFLRRDLGLSIALIDMYATCGYLVEALQLFDNLSDHDVVSWNVLIAGFVKYECSENALDCFRQMQLDGVSPDSITYACILKACGSIGATDKGSDIHFNFGEGWLESDLVVGTALVDMYAKGGLLAKAQDAFDNLLVRDTASWNALITGYAQLGELESVIATFDNMRGEGRRPSSATFLSVLNACSNAGLVDKGYTYFEALRGCYCLTPTLEHLTCMINFLGRAGQLDQAAEFIEKIPYQPNIFMWLTVLGACRKWDHAELGRHAFEMAMQLNDKETSAYVCIGNIFVDADLQEDERWWRK